MSPLHALAIVFELLCGFLGLKIYFQKKNKLLGAAWALAFALYVFFDSAMTFNWGISAEALGVVMFVAASSALVAMWQTAKK